jgi:hypothetical protein
VAAFLKMTVGLELSSYFFVACSGCCVLSDQALRPESCALFVNLQYCVPASHTFNFHLILAVFCERQQHAAAACAGRLSSLRHAACAMQMCTKGPGAKTSLHVQIHVLLTKI